MRRKKVSDLQNRWGGRADKAEASLEDVEKRPHRKANRSKICKATKGDHIQHELKPLYGRHSNILVWHCKCGKHGDHVYVCGKCKSRFNNWREYFGERSMFGKYCKKCDPVKKEQE